MFEFDDYKIRLTQTSENLLEPTILNKQFVYMYKAQVV